VGLTFNLPSEKLEGVFQFKKQICTIANAKTSRKARPAQGSVFHWTKIYYNKKYCSDMFKVVSKEFQAFLRIRWKALPLSSAKDNL
jgi:hypothetical protein